MKEEKRSGKKNNINIWMTCFQGWLVFKTKVGFSQYKLMIDKKTHWDLFICVVWDAFKNLHISLPKRKTQVLGSIPWSGKKSTKPKYLLFHGVKKTLVFVIEKPYFMQENRSQSVLNFVEWWYMHYHSIIIFGAAYYFCQ